MTQMMLFDSPVVASPVASRAPIAFVAPAIVAPKAIQSPSSVPRNEVSPSQLNEPKRGINHMGDLARLVLMRHDMMAARRTARRTAR
ncbi:hypothetical protein Pla52o_20580 [Novipirellula galeiformis]|uniref:Uncharacterized protein n=1 Tax=Novipirellula galeiformis TaxID=2528004 RepID=A0A5C6CKY4_9BACT|nr:hypothetical protein [Novipirellula galeiformis]TWU24134.1 hypothetical protein Pla52o_20580 [Novipirellula galeiformis]